MSKQVVLIPRVSEKSYTSAEMQNTFVFKVPVGISKQQIAEAVEAQFGVTVTNVNTAVIKGKAKRTVRKGGRRQEFGRQSDFKKAFVSVKEGDQIPIFKTDEEDNKKKTEAK